MRATPLPPRMCLARAALDPACHRRRSFLQKRHLATVFSSVASLVKSSTAGQLTLAEQDLAHMVALAPPGLTVRMLLPSLAATGLPSSPPRPGVLTAADPLARPAASAPQPLASDLAITMEPAGTSKAKRSKRRRCFLQACVDFVGQRHRQWCCEQHISAPEVRQLLRRRTLTRWHERFPLHELSLPSSTALPKSPGEGGAVVVTPDTDPSDVLEAAGFVREPGDAAEAQAARSRAAAEVVGAAIATLGHGEGVGCTFENVETWLQESVPVYAGQIVHVHETAARPAVFADLEPPLLEPVREALTARGIHKLYLHQVQGIQAIRAGRHLIIATSTASGKSTVYNVPVFEELLRNPNSVAMYMFPTKALAQDQLRALQDFVQASPALRDTIRPACFDGDVERDARILAGKAANVLLCNPDILHVTVLPHHEKWQRLLRNLKFLVMDEAHTYSGIFGAHVALMLRRLQRLTAVYGSRPTFIACSATIGNPVTHMKALVGLGVEDELVCIDTDSSAVGRKKFIVWNPPLLSELADQRREQESQFHREMQRAAAASGDIREALLLASSRAGSRGSPEQPVEAARPSRGVKRRKQRGSDVPAPRQRQRMRDKDRTKVLVREVALQRPKRARTDPSPESSPRLPSPVRLPAQVSAVRSADIESFAEGTYTTLSPPASDAHKGGASGYQAVLERGSRVLKQAREQWGELRGQLNAAADAFSGAGSVGNLRERPSGQSAPSAQTGGGGTGDTSGVSVQPPPHWREKWKARAEHLYPARRSAIVEGGLIIAALVSGGLKSITFTRVRQVAELLLEYTHERLSVVAPWAIRLVKSYRGGYLKQHRRDIERDMFAGKLYGIVATNALELGIDIGALDAVVLVGYPGSVSSLWQQSGRAGRGGRDAVAVLVTFDSPVDQYYARHPEELASRRPESVHLDLSNVNVLRQHAMCAAAELPLTAGDIARFGTLLGPVVKELRTSELLVPAPERRAGVDRCTLNAPGKEHMHQLSQAEATLQRLPDGRTSWATQHASPPHQPAERERRFEVLREAPPDAVCVHIPDTAPPHQRLFRGLFFARGAGYLLVNESDERGVVSMLGQPQRGEGSSLLRSDQPPIVKRARSRAWSLAPWVELPAAKVSMRAIDDVQYSVIDIGNGGKEVDTVEEWKTYFCLHPGAVYLQQGVSYKVERLDLVKRQAHVRVANVAYYTSPREHTDVFVLGRKASNMRGRSHYGRVSITKEVFGFHKIWKKGGGIFQDVDIALPPVSFRTFAVWCDVPMAVKLVLDKLGLDYLAGLHAANHAIVAVLPRFVRSERYDLGTECPSALQDRAKPLRFLVYDKRPGGTGVCAAAFPLMPRILAAAVELLLDCPCIEGCPTCVHDLACSQYNFVIDKAAALVILQECLLGHATLAKLNQSAPDCSPASEVSPAPSDTPEVTSLEL